MTLKEFIRNNRVEDFNFKTDTRGYTEIELIVKSRKYKFTGNTYFPPEKFLRMINYEITKTIGK